MIKKFCFKIKKYIIRKIYIIYLFIFCIRHSKEKIILIGGYGMGDLCISMAYFEEFLLKNPNEKFIIISSNKTRWLLERYNIGKCKLKYCNNKTISYLEMAVHSIDMSYLIRKLKRRNLIIADPWSYIEESMIFYEGLSALGIYRDAIFKVGYDASIIYAPAIKTELDLKIKSKSVLLNYFSNSSNIPIDDWINIIEFLNESGYNVYVNSPNQNKNEIKNVISLNLNMDELYSIANKFEMIISIRSGFLDYIIKECHHLICIYENYNFYNIYNLNKWNVKNLKIQSFLSTDKGYVELVKEGIKKWM